MKTTRMPHASRGTALLVVAALSVACADREAPLTPEVQHAAAVAGSNLLRCPAAPTGEPVTSMIGPAGGSMTLGHHTMQVPAGAVAVPIRFEMREVDSPYLEVQITVNRRHAFDFIVPVQVTLNYSRCGASVASHANLTVWKIDPETKERIRHMGGEHWRPARTITFTTGTLSNYAIAN